MKQFKKLVSTVLCALFIVALTFNVPVVAHATSAYTISISVGNNTDASFNTDELKVNGKAYSSAVVKTRKTDDGKDVPFKLVISDLAYGDEVSFEPNKLINIADGSKYYVKGIRVSGADALVNNGASPVTLKVQNDETYVAAYGVGVVIPYKVQYVDDKGNTLYPEETLYGAKDDKAIVPARHIRDYKPDEIEKEIKIEEGAVVKFVYTELPASIKYETIEEESTVYVNGGTSYTYEYEYVDGPTAVTNRVNNRPGVVNNRATRRTNTAENTTTVDTANENVGDATAQDQDEAASDDNSVAIDDEQTPASGDDKKIPDEDTPKSVVENSPAMWIWPVSIIIILAIAIVTIMVVLKKQKREE